MGNISKFLGSLSSNQFAAFTLSFWRKVDVKGEDECWPWLASEKRGYGQVSLPRMNGQRFKAIATRVAYFLAYDKDPEDKVVMHTCDNPPCCNPRHLIPGSQKENMTDKADKSRGYSAENHKHHASKLTPKHVLKIRKMLTDKKSYIKIAKIFGVSKQAIANINHKKTWKHVK